MYSICNIVELLYKHVTMIPTGNTGFGPLVVPLHDGCTLITMPLALLTALTACFLKSEAIYT